MRLFREPLRRYDRASADGVDHFAANSHFVAERIRRIYGRDAEVIHPPVDVDRFRAAAGTAPPAERAYYLFMGQLIPYKRPDLAVDACRRLGRPLVVAGDGPLRRALEKRAAGDPGIRFAGRVAGDDLPALYAGARGLLFPGIEDFGIVPVEAQAAGTPVVAFDAGGARETVAPGRTGVFFAEPTADALAEAMLDLERRNWDPAVLSGDAARFSPEHFRRAFTDFVRRHGPPGVLA